MQTKRYYLREETQRSRRGCPNMWPTLACCKHFLFCSSPWPRMTVPAYWGWPEKGLSCRTSHKMVEIGTHKLFRALIEFLSNVIQPQKYQHKKKLIIIIVLYFKKVNVFCRSQKYGCFDYNYQLNITWNRHSLSRLWLQRLSIKQQSELNIDILRLLVSLTLSGTAATTRQLIGLSGWWSLFVREKGSNGDESLGSWSWSEKMNTHHTIQ